MMISTTLFYESIKRYWQSALWAEKKPTEARNNFCIHINHHLGSIQMQKFPVKGLTMWLCLWAKNFQLFSLLSNTQTTISFRAHLRTKQCQIWAPDLNYKAEYHLATADVATQATRCVKIPPWINHGRICWSTCLRRPWKNYQRLK